MADESTSGSDTRRECLRYRTSAVLHSGGWLVTIGFGVAALALVGLDTSKPWGNRVGGAAFLWLGALFTYRMAIRPQIEVCRDAIRVRGPWSTVQFPASELVEATGDSLLRLHRKDGSTVNVLAVSTDNVHLVLRRRGRAERIADEINRYLGSGAPSASLVPDVSGVNWTLLLVLAAAAGLQIALLVLRTALD